MIDGGTFEIEVADTRDIEPWSLEPVSLTTFAWKKTYIQIVDYDEDGNLDYATAETLRVRDKQGDRVFVCKPEDDDEPNVFPGTYWREAGQ